MAWIVNAKTQMVKKPKSRNDRQVDRDAEQSHWAMACGTASQRVEYLPLSSSIHRMLHQPGTPGLLLLLAVFVAIFGSACTSDTANDNQPTPVLSGPPRTTFPMPPLNPSGDLGWVLRDGSRANLADYRSKILVLDFYATWCQPCRQSIPRLNTLQMNFGPKDVQVVGLNVGGPDDRVKVDGFAKELNIQYPLGFPDKALTDLFLSDNPTIPQTFVFTRAGRLAKRFIGYEETTGNELDKAIAAAVATRESADRD